MQLDREDSVRVRVLSCKALELARLRKAKYTPVGFYGRSTLEQEQEKARYAQFKYECATIAEKAYKAAYEKAYGYDARKKPRHAFSVVAYR